MDDYTLNVYANAGGTGTPAATDVITGTTKTFSALTAGTYYVRVTPSNNVNPDPVCALQSVVVGASDTTAPVLQSLAIQSGLPTQIVLTYNEALNPSSLAVSKFEAKVNGATVNIASANATNTTQAAVNLQNPVQAGDVVTLSYTPGTTGSRIADTAANFAAGFTNQAVTNNLVPIPTANLWGWYKADAGVTTTGNAVEVWVDQSGNNRHLTYNQSTPELVAGALNGKPVIRGNGNGSLRSAQNFPDTASTGLTIYIVAAQKAADSAYNAFYGVGTGQVSLIRGATAGTVMAKTMGGNTLNFSGVTDDTFFTMRMAHNGTTQYFGLNSNAASSGPANAQAYVQGVFNVLSLVNNTSAGVKDIAEIIIYTEFHDATKRAEVEGYLQTKYAHY